MPAPYRKVIAALLPFLSAQWQTIGRSVRMGTMAFAALLTFTFALNSCRNATDDVLDAGTVPTTRLIFESIDRTDSLSTKVRLQWSGSVKDGYITGYKIYWAYNAAPDPNAALATVSQITSGVDSTFLFSLRGSAGGTVHFYVQALDNRGRAGVPAYLQIKVKNFSPKAQIPSSSLPVANDVFSVLTFAVATNDPDGAETIDSLFVRVNNGGWFPINPRASLVSLVANDPSTTNSTNTAAKVYSTVETTSIISRLESGLASGLRVGDSNRVYVRCKDIAGAFSNIDSSSRRIFVRRKTSDLLVIDSWNGAAPNADAINAALLGAVYPNGYDRIDLYQNNNAYQPIQPRLWKVNFGLILQQYAKVFWYSDVSNHIINNVADPNSALIQTAAPALKDYLDNNGRLLVSCRNYIIPDGTPNTKSYPNGSQITRILSIDTIFNNDLNVRMQSNVSLSPAAGSGYPTLKLYNGLVTGFMPFANLSDASVLYTGPMTRSGSPYANNLVAIRRQNAFTGKTNLVFFGIDFHLFSGDAAAQQAVLDRVLNQEFNW